MINVNEDKPSTDAGLGKAGEAPDTREGLLRELDQEYAGRCFFCGEPLATHACNPDAVIYFEDAD